MPNKRRWFETGFFTETSSTYQINCELICGETSIRSRDPAKLIVVVPNPLGHTVWPNFAGMVHFAGRQKNEVVEFYIDGQGDFRRVNGYVDLLPIQTSQFRLKIEAHENKHVLQYNMEPPWKQLYDAKELYNKTLKHLTSTNMALPGILWVLEERISIS